jgi:hypothetical protein
MLTVAYFTFVTIQPWIAQRAWFLDLAGRSPTALTDARPSGNHYA